MWSNGDLLYTTCWIFTHVSDVDCGPAPEINNTVIDYTGEGFFREAFYSCNEGYYLAGGSSSRKCSAGGTWSGKPIVCERN